MTFAEMKTFLIALGHGTDTDTAQSAMLTRAYLELAGRRRWSWLETTNVAGATITLGSATVTGLPAPAPPQVTSVDLSVGTQFYGPMTPISKDEWEELNHTDRENGVPKYYAYINGTIRTHPRADQVYTVELSYINTPSASTFDAAGESPPFDEKFHVAIPWKVAAWLAFRQRDWNQFSAANAEYERIVREMEQQEQTANQGSHIQRSDYYDQVK